MIAVRVHCTRDADCMISRATGIRPDTVVDDDVVYERLPALVLLEVPQRCRHVLVRDVRPAPPNVMSRGVDKPTGCGRFAWVSPTEPRHRRRCRRVRVRISASCGQNQSAERQHDGAPLLSLTHTHIHGPVPHVVRHQRRVRLNRAVRALLPQLQVGLRADAVLAAQPLARAVGAWERRRAAADVLSLARAWGQHAMQCGPIEGPVGLGPCLRRVEERSHGTHCVRTRLGERGAARQKASR